MNLTKSLPGFEAQTSCGSCYVMQKHYPVDMLHGHDRLERWLHTSMEAAHLIQRDRRWLDFKPEDCLFLDIETTGLGDSDTLAFMIGVGFFTGNQFELRRYFLREPEEETAQLEALGELLDAYPALVTFNGKKFDIPVLHERYRVNGMGRALTSMPNLDLLISARLLWRRLPSRRLGALENDILGITRSSEDVPGQFIPRMYYEYLSDGEIMPIQQIAYHNEIDVLSMVTLGAVLLQTFAQPDLNRMHLDEVIALGSWYLKLEMVAEAEQTLTNALQVAQDQASKRELLSKLAALFARTDPVRSATFWEAWAALEPDNPAPCIELSKYHENERRAQIALQWAEAAHYCYQIQPPSSAKGLHLNAVQNRIKRLQKKVARA